MHVKLFLRRLDITEERLQSLRDGTWATLYKEGNMSEDRESNIRSLEDFKRRKKEKKEDRETGHDPDALRLYFEELEERNRKVREKMKEERNKHNRKVKRDYRLKDD